MLREADALVTRMVRKHGSTTRLAVPGRPGPAGRGAGRETIVLRPVNSRDGMTADFARVPAAVVDELARRWNLPRVDAVLYDVTNKPPATIELE